MIQKSFASDNYAGIHPLILKAIGDANCGHAKAYGADNYTAEAIERFKQHFGNDIAVYFVTTGTAANVLSLSALLKPYEGVICAETAHINVDECGAPERYTGCKLLTIPTNDGKLTVDAIKAQLINLGDQHKVQPKVISISQTTECGTLYTQAELLEITKYAHANNMYVHMDGARLSNAAASLNLGLAALTRDVGIDVLCFGGTKDGMMLGEAVVFLNLELAQGFKYIRKQGMQLVSKMRFISAQFSALLTDDLWLKNANHANAMAQLLAREIAQISEIKLNRSVQANAVFAILNPNLIKILQDKYYFYVWNEDLNEVRWMTSWDTTPADIAEFVAFIKTSLRKNQV
jgi:threonine aldolase